MEEIAEVDPPCGRGGFSPTALAEGARCFGETAAVEPVRRHLELRIRYEITTVQGQVLDVLSRLDADVSSCHAERRDVGLLRVAKSGVHPCQIEIWIPEGASHGRIRHACSRRVDGGELVEQLHTAARVERDVAAAGADDLIAVGDGGCSGRRAARAGGGVGRVLAEFDEAFVLSQRRKSLGY